MPPVIKKYISLLILLNIFFTLALSHYDFLIRQPLSILASYWTADCSLRHPRPHSRNLADHSSVAKVPSRLCAQTSFMMGPVQLWEQNSHGVWSNVRLHTGLGVRMQVPQSCGFLQHSSLQRGRCDPVTVNTACKLPDSHSKPHRNVSSSWILTNARHYGFSSAK